MDKQYGFWLPPDVSTHGAGIDQLIFIVHMLMLVLVVGWGFFFFYSLIKFRARPGHSATYALRPFKLSSYVEVAVFGLELLLLFGLSMPLFASSKNPPPPEEAFTVRIVAQQFAWNIHYPGSDQKFGATKPDLVTDANAIGLDATDAAAKDDIVTINEFHFPVHEKVVVRLTSKDVIHSFSVPVLRVKHDAIPGMTAPLWFEAKDTGNFEITCAQLCGNNHYRMRGFVNIETREAFDAWMKTKNAEQHPETI